MTDNPTLHPQAQRPTEAKRAALWDWLSWHAGPILRWEEDPEVEFSVFSDVRLSITKEALDHRSVDGITAALDALDAERLLRHQIPLQLRECRRHSDGMFLVRIPELAPLWFLYQGQMHRARHVQPPAVLSSHPTTILIFWVLTDGTRDRLTFERAEHEPPEAVVHRLLAWIVGQNKKGTA